MAAQCQRWGFLDRRLLKRVVCCSPLRSSCQTAAAATHHRSVAHMMVPTGTPLNDLERGEEARLSVVSYNVLAPIYVRPLDGRTGNVQEFAAFEWCTAAALDWAARCPRIVSELRQSAADLICLQEVQFEAAQGGGGGGDPPEFVLPAWTQLEGYTALLPEQADLAGIAQRNQRVLGALAPVGNALLYRHDRLCERAAPAPKKGEKAPKSATTRVGAVLHGREGGPLAGMCPTAVFSVHLDATHEEQRVSQIVRCMQIARQLGTREVIIGGGNTDTTTHPEPIWVCKT
jgi:endonuclease/exonuclease/phosphatase family metal-dependent hydrolase